ncbi:hypothetical protein EYD10_07203 [Varanus komodoensis]|nr:hypothetical protein EYD10_07203 [Varanus komodoensis]
MATFAEAARLDTLFWEELTCCLCLDLFNSPVLSIKCSHSFCKECISQHCEKVGAKATCPTCRSELPPNGLVGNRSLANIVEIVQRIKTPGICESRPGNYCLNSSWRNDQEASISQDLKRLAGLLPYTLKDVMKISEVSKQIEVAIEAIDSCRKDSVNMKDCASHSRSSIIEVFAFMKKYFNDQEKMVLDVIDLAYPEVEQKTELMKEQLSGRIDMLLDLQSNSEEVMKCVSSEQEVYAGSDIGVNEFSLAIQKFSRIIFAVEEFKRQLEKAVLGNYPAQLPEEPTPGTSNGIQMEMTEDVITSSSNSWASDVTLDPERVSRRLELSEDRKTVMVPDFLPEYEPSRWRFRNCQVTGSQSFSEGHHYWEVSTQNSTGWAIGVARREIGHSERLGRTDLSWCIEWSSNQLSAWHRDQQTPLTEQKPLLVGVFLDIPNNSLSFYCLPNKETCLHQFQINVTHPVYPAFWIYGMRVGDYLTVNSITKH